MYSNGVHLCCCYGPICKKWFSLVFRSQTPSVYVPRKLRRLYDKRGAIKVHNNNNMLQQTKNGGIIYPGNPPLKDLFPSTVCLPSLVCNTCSSYRGQHDVLSNGRTCNTCSFYRGQCNVISNGSTADRACTFLLQIPIQTEFQRFA
jgi:hypothetical protein